VDNSDQIVPGISVSFVPLLAGGANL